MPLDLTLPLEVNRSRDFPNVTSAVMEGEHVLVRYGTTGRDTGYFNPTTGIYNGHETSDNPARLRNKSDEVAVKYFRIFFGHQDWGKADWRYLQDDSEYQFDNGKAANEKAKALNRESAEAGAPWKFMVKSHTVMSPNHAWREWMQERFASGEYTPMPWKDEPWYNPDHFAHAAMADPFKVAFVESPINGADDKMTVLNPGRYLERFYSQHLNPQEIAAWAARADSEAELLFAATPDEIEDVYVNGGIDSCMKYAGDSSNFPLGIQPTRVYGAGDLQLAYLRRRGKIVARALVWPEKKRIGRIYGDAERLRNRLVGEGYTVNEGDRMAFNGARLLRIEMGGEIVLPYLDWSMSADDAGDHLVIRGEGGKYRGQTQNGTASGRSVAICGHEGCRTVIPDGQGFYNSGTGRQMCTPCADRVLVRCAASHNFFPLTGRGSDNVRQIMSRDGQTPYPGFRGGYVNTQYMETGRHAPYRMINDVVYPSTEVRLRAGSSRVYEVLPVDA